MQRPVSSHASVHHEAWSCSWSSVWRALDHGRNPDDFIGTVAELLRHAPDRVDEPVRIHQSAIRIAAGIQHAELVDMLLDHGADPHQVDQTGKTLLHAVVVPHWGINSQRTRVADAVAIIRRLHTAGIAMHALHDGQTALAVAVRSSASEPIISALLDAGADPRMDAVEPQMQTTKTRPLLGDVASLGAAMALRQHGAPWQSPGERHAALIQAEHLMLRGTDPERQRIISWICSQDMPSHQDVFDIAWLLPADEAGQLLDRTTAMPTASNAAIITGYERSGHPRIRAMGLVDMIRNAGNPISPHPGTAQIDATGALSADAWRRHIQDVVGPRLAAIPMRSQDVPWCLRTIMEHAGEAWVPYLGQAMDRACR